jgi:hypothetical protein
MIRIKTSDPGYPELRVPMMLQGPIPAEGAADEDHEHAHPAK